MVKVRSLIGLLAFLSFAISQPVRPPDEGVGGRGANRSLNAVDVPRSTKADQNRVKDAVSRRVQSVLYKKEGRLSTFWAGEQFEPATTEPPSPFDPPLDPEETPRLLGMRASDAGSHSLVDFHRLYDKVLDPASVPPRFADMFARRYQLYQGMLPVRNQDPRLFSFDQAMQYYGSDAFKNRMESMNDLIK